jgi:hypothetical protein
MHVPCLAACALALAFAGCGAETRSPTSTAQSSDAGNAYDGGYSADGTSQAASDTGQDESQYDGGAVPADESYPPSEVTADVPVEEVDFEPVQRPEDIAQWKSDHYKSAKLENDPKLAEAVQHLDQPQWRESEDAAKLLASLLTLDEKPKAAEPAPTNDGYGGGYGGSGGGAARSSDGYGGGGYGGSGYGGGGYGTTTPEMAQIPPELAREVVAALGRNTSQWTGEALKKLLVGEVDTPLDKQSMFAEALHAMANNMRPQYEDTIFELATAPQKLIKAPENNAQTASSGATGYGGGYGGGYGSPGGGALTVEWVRPELLREMEEWAPSTLRVRLARHLDNRDVTRETAEEFERILIADDPRNLPAQIVLFQNPLTSESTKQQIEQRLAQGSRGALAHMMGVEADGMGLGGYGVGNGSGYGGSGYGGSGYGRSGYDGGYGRGGNPPRSIRPIERQRTFHGFYLQEGRPSREEGRPSRDGGGYGGGYGGYGSSVAAPPEQDPTETYSQLAALLWTDDNADKLGDILLDLERLDTRADLVRILASMPTAGARRNLQKLFDKFQDEGPSSFTTAGLLGQNLMDPAFLLVAKKAYHDKETQRPARGRAAPQNDPYGGYGAAGGAAGLDPWEQEVETYVRFLSETLAQGESPWQAEATADVDGDAGAEPAETGSDAEVDTGPRGAMPVRLHRGAEVVEEYHARWPTDVADKLPGANIGPLEIHYVRIEEENRPAQLAASYRRQAGRKPIERTSDGGGWIDGLVENGPTGDRHSIDIRIYNDPDTSGVNAQLRPNDERPIVIEILTVTIPGVAQAEAAADAGQASNAGAAEEELPF